MGCMWLDMINGELPGCGLFSLVEKKNNNNNTSDPHFPLSSSNSTVINSLKADSNNQNVI